MVKGRRRAGRLLIPGVLRLFARDRRHRARRVIRMRSSGLASGAIRHGSPLALSAVLMALGPTACGRLDVHGGRPDASGRQLAERYCQSCHLLPTPESLDRTTWEQWVLPRMARRLGLEGTSWTAQDEPVGAGEGGRLVREADVFPGTPQISYAEWERLAGYYLEGAPASLPAPPARPPITTGVPGFRVRVPDFRVARAMITLVHVAPALGRIYVGDATPGHSKLAVLDGRGRTIDTLPLPSPISHLRVSGDTLALLLMGMLHPSDAPRGSLRLLVPGHRNAAGHDWVWRVDGLRRPVYASYADLSGDGIEDAVVSEFGHLTGQLAWYERLPGGGSRRHPLLSAPGALTTLVRDLDGDGHLDVLALTAQGDEGVWLFRGQPGGGFSRRQLLRFPPSFGSTSMEVRDLDQDGDLDLVHTSGDLGDYPPRAKPYHGARIFLNDGGWRFVEHGFFPLHGAFKAVARDFDSDGDIDIAAIAFYPDYASDSPDPFVYLENIGGLEFRASTFPGAGDGRWLTMDAGDIDGDGDDDLVLGSFVGLGAEGARSEILARWQEPDAPTLVILENTGGKAAAASPRRERGAGATSSPDPRARPR